MFDYSVKFTAYSTKYSPDASHEISLNNVGYISPMFKHTVPNYFPWTLSCFLYQIPIFEILTLIAFSF